jgi:hypothetical protein
MVPSSEHIFTAPLTAAQFGPTYPLLVSPWLSLAIWAHLRRGPRAVVLPRGARLSALPRVLRGCSHLQLVPWSGEAHVVAVGDLLSVVAELLLRSAVLVHEHAPDARAVANVALPLTDDADTDADVSDADFSDVDGNADAADPADAADSADAADAADAADGPDTAAVDVSDASATAPAAAPAEPAPADPPSADPARSEALAVQKSLALSHSVGIVKLVRLPRPAAACGGVASEGARSCRWLPLCIDFGLPLATPEACEAACAAMAARHLFADESLRRHAAAIEGLRALVERCVADTWREVMAEEGGAADEEEESDGERAAASPPTPLLFDGTRLCQLREAADLY